VQDGHDTAHPLGAPYAWFIASGASWYTIWGMQQVIFSWLLVGVLQEDPARVGSAQMLMALPALFLMPLAGSLADRFGRRRVLLVVHVLSAGVAAATAGWLMSGRLSLGGLLVLAPIWGSLMSVQFPAREAILFDVAHADLARGSAGTTLAQFAFLAVGNALAALTTQFGTPMVLAGQSLLAALGILPLPKLPRGASSRTASRTEAGWGATLLEGLGTVASIPNLRLLAILTVANGLLFLGPYFVAGPILVRDVYGGGAGDVGLFFMMFPLGTGLSSALLVLRGRIENGLAALVAALGLGAACVLAIALEPAFEIVLGIVFVWGCAGGVFITMGRTLFLEGAPASHRARVLSVQGMALMGSAPLSHLLTGLVAEAFGVATAFRGAGLAMLGVVALACLRLRRDAKTTAAP